MRFPRGVPLAPTPGLMLANSADAAGDDTSRIRANCLVSTESRCRGQPDGQPLHDGLWPPAERTIRHEIEEEICCSTGMATWWGAEAPTRTKATTLRERSMPPSIRLNGNATIFIGNRDRPAKTLAFSNSLEDGGFQHGH
jgi:hypothetical protein